MFDGKAFGLEMVSIVKGYFERNVSPLKKRVDTMERRLAALEAEKGIKPRVRVPAAEAEQ